MHVYDFGAYLKVIERCVDVIVVGVRSPVEEIALHGSVKLDLKLLKKDGFEKLILGS